MENTNTRTKIYSIRQDLQGALAEFNSVENALSDSSFLVIKEITGQTPRISGDRTYQNSFSNYEFYSLHNKMVVDYLEINNWILKYEGRCQSRPFDFSYTEHEMRVSITDPCGQITYIDSNDSEVKRYFENNENGHCKNIEKTLYPILKLFRKWSQERDLRTVQLIIENEKLKIEIQNLLVLANGKRS